MLALTFADFNFIGTAHASAGASSNGLLGMAPFVIILGIMYFFIIRPQNKKAKEHRDMVASLKRGDRVVVAHGILGVVSQVVDDHELLVEIADGVNIKVVRASVSQVIAKTSVSEGKPAKAAALKTKTTKKPSAKK